MSVKNWSNTASGNDAVIDNIDFREGTPNSSIDNSAREMMALIDELRAIVNGRAEK